MGLCSNRIRVPVSRDTRSMWAEARPREDKMRWASASQETKLVGTVSMHFQNCEKIKCCS